MSLAPEFTIVTPSYNMLGYLQRCVRSVADQQGATFEHLVIDGGSSDGTAEWLREREGIIATSEKDEGMYDAINKGFRRARGDVVAYLNCDEQYLPETLRSVSDFFRDHPEVDLVFGDALLIRPDGSLIAVQKGYPLRWYYVLASHLYAYSCTLFLRAEVIHSGQLFDVHYRDIGDAEFAVRLLRAGHRAAHLKRYLGAFTMTGSNMSTGENARQERERALHEAPRWVRIGSGALNLLRLTEKWLAGGYRRGRPLRYSVYDSDDALRRQSFEVGRPSFRWKTA